MATSSPIAKYHLVEATLAARICDGAYDEADLPGERELAADFGVARVTVRNALRRLETKGSSYASNRDAQPPSRGEAPRSGAGCCATISTSSSTAVVRTSEKSSVSGLSSPRPSSLMRCV